MTRGPQKYADVTPSESLFWTPSGISEAAYDGRGTGRRETDPLPPQRDGPGPGLVRQGLDDLRHLVHQRGDAGSGGVDRAVVFPARQPAVLDPPLGGVGLVRGRAL